MLKFTEKLIRDTKDAVIKKISLLFEHEQEQARKRARDVDRTDIKLVTQLLSEHAMNIILTPLFVAAYIQLSPRLFPLAHPVQHMSPTIAALVFLISMTMLTLLRLRATLLGIVRINQHHLNPTGDHVNAQLRIFENGVVIIIARGYHYYALPLHRILIDVKPASFYGDCSKLLVVEVDLDKNGEPIGLTYMGEFDWLPFIMHRRRIRRKIRRAKKINFPIRFSPQPAC